MAKYDRVDRLMEQAGAPPRSKNESLGVEAAPLAGSSPELRESGMASTPEARPAAGAPGQLGRQLLGNLDLWAPALGKVLQSFPHSGVQAVGRTVQAADRFRPFLKIFAGAPAPGAPAVPAPPAAPAVPAASSERQAALEAEVKALQQRVESQEDQLRRARESLERTVAEQGTLSHLAHQLGDRSRLLTAGLLILLVLVIAQTVLLAVTLRH